MDRHFLNELNTVGTTKDIKIIKIKEIRQIFFCLIHPVVFGMNYAVIISINGLDLIIYIIRVSLSSFEKNIYICVYIYDHMIMDTYVCIYIYTNYMYSQRKGPNDRKGFLLSNFKDWQLKNELEIFGRRLQNIL